MNLSKFYRANFHPARICPALAGAAVMATTLIASAQVPASAQVTRIPPAASDRFVPPYEVVNIVRSVGLDPLGAPALRGVTYRMLATDRAGRDVSVVIDARFGDILLVERADGPYPERRIARMPPDYDPEFFERAPRPYSTEPLSPAPSHPPRAIKPTSRTAEPAAKHPPLPKPRPQAVASQSAAPVPAPPAAAPPAPKAETSPAQEPPTKWKDEPAPTNAPAVSPTVPDVTPLE